MRRQATRYPLVHPVELFVASVRHAATLEDLSRTGMFLRVVTPLPTGIGIKLAMPGTGGDRLQTRGTIIRSVATGYRTGIGVALRDPCEPADELFGLGVEHLIRHAASHAPGLHGELAEIGLPALLTMLEHERKTCRLVVSAGHMIWIDLVDGRIVDARTSAGASDAWAVMMTALDLREGRFELVRTEPAAATYGLLPITHLLLEHARRTDERFPRRALA